MQPVERMRSVVRAFLNRTSCVYVEPAKTYNVRCVLAQRKFFFGAYCSSTYALHTKLYLTFTLYARQFNSHWGPKNSTPIGAPNVRKHRENFFCCFVFPRGRRCLTGVGRGLTLRWSSPQHRNSGGSNGAAANIGNADHTIDWSSLRQCHG